MSKSLWYSIQARAAGGSTTVEIRIHDEIGAGGVTSETFLQELARVASTAAHIVLSINSPGGSVFDAIAIYNALTKYSGRITGRVDGVAASAASLVLMAAHRIVMPENAMLMIHNPWAVAGGEAEELRRLADMMDKVRASFVAAYVKRSGQPADEIKRMMDETTWMDAFEAQRLGFCDEVEDPVRLAASGSAVAVLAKYKGVPSALMAGLRRGEQRQREGGAVETTQALVQYVYAECRARRIPELAEAIVLHGATVTRAETRARIDAAEEIAGICLAAKRPKMAVDFVKAGLGVEQIRARLFDLAVAESEAVVISNLQRPEPAATMQGHTALEKMAQEAYGRRTGGGGLGA